MLKGTVAAFFVFIAIALYPASALASTGSYRYLTNYYPSGGSLGECAHIDSGTFGNSWFATNRATASFGGTCNSAAGRPAGWLKVRLEIYDNGALVSFQGDWPNAAWASNIQLTRPRIPGDDTHRATGLYYLSGAGYFVNGSRYAGP